MKKTFLVAVKIEYMGVIKWTKCKKYLSLVIHIYFLLQSLTVYVVNFETI